MHQRNHQGWRVLFFLLFRIRTVCLCFSGVKTCASLTFCPLVHFSVFHLKNHPEYVTSGATKSFILLMRFSTAEHGFWKVSEVLFSYFFFFHLSINSSKFSQPWESGDQHRENQEENKSLYPDCELVIQGLLTLSFWNRNHNHIVWPARQLARLNTLL